MNKMSVWLVGISLFAGTILSAQATTMKPIVELTIGIGDVATNHLFRQRVPIPVSGPIVLKLQKSMDKCIKVSPVKPFFESGDAVEVDLEIDLHGFEGEVHLPKRVIKTQNIDYVLDLSATVQPFSQYTPNHFLVRQGGTPVHFSFRGISAQTLYANLTVAPADAPVSVAWAVNGGGESLNGVIAAMENPPLVSQDGKLHEGILTVTTTTGETDFLHFQWRIPVPAVPGVAPTS